MSASVKITPWHYMRDDLVKQYGEEIGTFLAKRIGKLVREVNDPCMDCFRVADQANEKEMAEYKAMQEGGCCGSVDLLVTHFKSGRTFLYGFNYGH